MRAAYFSGLMDGLLMGVAVSLIVCVLGWLVNAVMRSKR